MIMDFQTDMQTPAGWPETQEKFNRMAYGPFALGQTPLERAEIEAWMYSQLAQHIPTAQEMTMRAFGLMNENPRRHLTGVPRGTLALGRVLRRLC
jgi:hypothetical protein